MSKIGRLNFALQEQANELGYDTVQEALDNGCVVGTELFGDAPRLIRPINMQKKLDELEEAHKAWLKEKEEVIKGLVDCYKHLHGFPPEVYDNILRAIEFIKKGEI